MLASGAVLLAFIFHVDWLEMRARAVQTTRCAGSPILHRLRLPCCATERR